MKAATFLVICFCIATVFATHDDLYDQLANDYEISKGRLQDFDAQRAFGVNDHNVHTLAKFGEQHIDGFQVQSNPWESAGVSDACFYAAARMGQSYGACTATFGYASSLFAENNVPTQSDVSQYCDAPCKALFEANITEFTTACSGAEIVAIETATANDPSPFRFYKMLVFLRLPCVSRPNAAMANGKEYCLPSFASLIASVHAAEAAQTGLTGTQLTNSCTKCLGIFMAAWVAYAEPIEVKNLAFIDLICTKDFVTDTWCAVEMDALKVLPSTTTEEQLAKNLRTCSTSCTLKWIVKVVSAFKYFNQSAEELAQERQYFNILNAMCSRNENDEPCAIAITRFSALTQGGHDAGCITAPIPSCANATCLSYASNFLDIQGCCYSSLANNLIDESGAPSLEGVSYFLHGVCGLTLPDECPRYTGALSAHLVIQNLRWVWFVANAALFRAAIIEDIARAIGARPADINLGEISQGSGTQAHGFTTLAITDAVIPFTVSTDTEEQGEAATTTYNQLITNSALGIPSTSILTNTKYDSRADPSTSVGVSYSASAILMSSSSGATVMTGTGSTTGSGTTGGTSSAPSTSVASLLLSVILVVATLIAL